MYEQPKSKKRIVRNCNDRRKGTDQPDVCTVHALDVTEKKQMYRRELIGMEEKVKETAEQIEELLKSMRELGV